MTAITLTNLDLSNYMLFAVDKETSEQYSFEFYRMIPALLKLEATHEDMAIFKETMPAELSVTRMKRPYENLWDYSLSTYDSRFATWMQAWRKQVEARGMSGPAQFYYSYNGPFRKDCKPSFKVVVTTPTGKRHINLVNDPKRLGMKEGGYASTFLEKFSPYLPTHLTLCFSKKTGELALTRAEHTKVVKTLRALMRSLKLRLG